VVRHGASPELTDPSHPARHEPSDAPGVAVRVLEEDEAHVVELVGDRVRVLAQLRDVADLHAARHELRVRLADVRDDELQALQRARRHVRDDAALADHDRAARAGRRQLDDAGTVADTGVVVDGEAELLGVELLGAVDVRHRDDDDFQSPVHEWSLSVCVVC
jgi:hypothetical protein